MDSILTIIGHGTSWAVVELVELAALAVVRVEEHHNNLFIG